MFAYVYFDLLQLKCIIAQRQSWKRFMGHPILYPTVGYIAFDKNVASVQTAGFRWQLQVMTTYWYIICVSNAHPRTNFRMTSNKSIGLHLRYNIPTK